MKKVISYALAASIAGTSLGQVKIERVEAVEDNLNLNNSANKDNTNIEIENMEPIVSEKNDETDKKEDTTPNVDSSEGGFDTSESEGNTDSTQGESSQNKVEGEDVSTEEKPSIDENLGNKDESSDIDSDNGNVEDPSGENNNEGSNGEVDNNNDITDSTPENPEDLLEDIPQDGDIIENKEEVVEEETDKYESEDTKVTGRLELDINFAMPVVNSDNLDIQVELRNKDNTLGTIDLSKGLIDLKNDQTDGENLENTTKKDNKSKKKNSKNNTVGKLDNGITYKIEKYDYKRQPIDTDAKDESIYYIKVTFEGLERETYSLEVSGSGYDNVSIEDIDIIDYSKRVRIGNTSSETEYSSTFLAGDVDGNNEINMADYEEVLNSIGKKKSEYDFNRDGKVDIADLTFVYENLGKTKEEANVDNTDKIIDIEEINIDENETNVNIDSSVLEDIFLKDNSLVKLEKSDGEAPSEENPLKIGFDFGLSKRRNAGDSIEMEQIIIRAPEKESDDASAPSKGFITVVDENGQEHEVKFDDDNIVKRSSASNDIVIDLGSQIAVKQISINVTGNRNNKNISQIAKIEFLNNVYKEIPKPEMNIPVIKTLETSTEMHDERITISWEPQPNVTAYEVKYEKLNSNGQAVKTKKLQTNKTNLNILDKDIKPYDMYRVSVQSLNGQWESGYELESGDAGTESHIGFDGKADNVDKDFNPLESYYNGDKGSVTEIQVIPLRAPEVPRNLTTISGYKSFTVNWEDHRQARDFDIYYKKVGSSSWIKANETDENGNRLVVSETSDAVTNPNKNNLVRSHSYTINQLEDNTIYEVRVTATNHLGTSKMSETYLASTVSILEPTLSQYKLINKPTSENKIGTEHIIDVRNKLDEDGWAESDDYLTYDSEYAVVDGDFSTSLKCSNWDMGAYYGSNRGSEITFDDEYEIGKIILTKTFEQGFDGWFARVKVTYWDEEENKNEMITESIQTRTSNGQQYHIIKLPKPINAKKIKVETGGGGWQTISELMFYKYDSIEDDIKSLYADDLRLEMAKDVTQEKINSLYERLNTKDPESDEYHPDRTSLLKELDNAQKLFNDKEVSAKITTLDAAIRTDNVGPSLGMENSYQSLGSVARPNGENAEEREKITVYMGSSDSNTKVDIAFLQNYGQPGQYISKVYTISPGVTEIEIPTILSADVEKGGQVMARVTAGSTQAEVKVRLSNVYEIPKLNVNNIINDSSKEQEVKDTIRTYIRELKTYVNEVEGKYPESVNDEDKLDNIYTYDKTTSILNTTDIEGDRFTLTLPATEIHKGITEGLNGNEDAEVERVYNALLAWEQEVKVAYAKKGVFEEVKDFNGDGIIDDEDNKYFNLNKAPLTRVNVKYQRMMMGAAAYASSHHIGVGFGSSSYIQGVPYKFDDEGNVTNPDEAQLYGTLMGHEIGHAMDISQRIYPETSNNLLASITETMMNENNPLTSGAMSALYEKVTSNTIGLSTNRSVVLGMLWQPYLAYEDNDTYKMLLTDFDEDTSNDSYFAKLNRAYRAMTSQELANGDRDQYLIRLTSKVAEKDLSSFYMAHGIIPNAETMAYVSQFEEETRPIQYINDEARRMRMDGKANMEADTVLSASFANDPDGNEVKAGSYIDSNEVKINLSVNKSEENILGYEIYRNGLPCGFIERDKDNSETIYTDTLDSMNNRVVEYKAVAYDYNLNATNEVELGAVKIRHEGGVAKNSIEITSSTISVNEESNDIHGSTANEDLKKALDNDENTYYEGRMLEKGEYNSAIYEPIMNPNNDPYIVLDTTELKTLVGIKYTAPTEEKGLLFKKSKVADSSLKKYQIEVSKDGVEWTIAKKETLDLSAENPTATIYFDAEGVTGGAQLASYNARYVRIKALDTKKISAAEIELITPPGDNIEIGVAEDNINYENGIGLLQEDYVYALDNADTDENEFKYIPKGSVIITGEYRGNPAFNVPLVLNENDENIADEYNGLLFAKVPDSGDLEEISEGNWVYFVEPEYVDQFMAENKKIFAELYRTDTADASEYGQRLVSDTFKIDVPEVLPTISLSKTSAFRASKEIVTLKIDKNTIKTVSQNR